MTHSFAGQFFSSARINFRPPQQKTTNRFWWLRLSTPFSHAILYLISAKNTQALKTPLKKRVKQQNFGEIINN